MISPPKLKEGDNVALIATSRLVTKDQMQAGIQVLNSWGLNVDNGDQLYSTNGYFAGTDQERLNDLQHAIDSRSISAIFCARGGYGLSRIIDNVNCDGLMNSPKWLIGFSDITSLHLKLNAFDIESIHGIMPIQFDYEGVTPSLESLHDLLFHNTFKHEFNPHIQNRLGSCQGRLIGGNLSLLVDSLGTYTELDTTGKILFIEEIDEYYYKIDRMFNHLKRAGKFENIKGLIIGQFTELKDTQIPFGFSLEEIVHHHLRDINIPVSFNIPIGHESHNIALPCGREVQLSVEEDRVSLFS